MSLSRETPLNVNRVTPKVGRMELKDVLKRLLKKDGISITYLSKRTKVPVQTIHNWLNGMEPRSISQLRKIADYFEVSLDYLCFGIEQKETQKGFEQYKEEINAGVFEVVLRRVGKR